MINHAKSQGRVGVTQAKVTRANGDIEYYYSTPPIPFWRRKTRRWARQRLAAFKSEENQT